MSIALKANDKLDNEINDNIAINDDKLSVVTETWWPFNHKNDHGEIVGSSTGWVKKVLDNSEVPYDISLYPWHRSYQLALTQKNILIYSIFRSKDREHLFHWVCPLIDKPTQKIYKLRHRTDIVVNKEEDLGAYSINAVRGTYTQNYLVDIGLKENSNLHLASDNDANLTMLLKGRVDLIVEVEEAIYQYVNDAGYNDDYVEEVYAFKDQPALCMALSKNTADDLVKKVREAHQSLLIEKSH